MKYEFDKTLDHKHNASYRWDLPGMPEDLIGMGTADLDYTCAPCIRDALVPIAEENCYNYRQHTQKYYDAVTGWYKRCYGLEIRKEWLSNVPSTIGALRVAMGCFAKPGDAVLVQGPVFAPRRAAWCAASFSSAAGGTRSTLTNLNRSSQRSVPSSFCWSTRITRPDACSPAASWKSLWRSVRVTV